VAEVLAEVRERIPGTVVFIFQPAEEGAPEGEEGGAKMMIAQGALENPLPQAIFGLHVTSRLPVGVIGYRPGPTMASTDRFSITIQGKQMVMPLDRGLSQYLMAGGAAMAAALVAAWLPARRAALVDPVDILRGAA